jgi:diguanylate cyclase (GGDEF)-like protein
VETKKALLIDGKNQASEQIIPLLEKHKCEITAIKGGLRGINTIYEEKPDLVFLDSSVSDIPIYQICKLLKNDSESENLPIVVLGKSKSNGLGIFNLKDARVDYVDLSDDLDSVNQQIKEILNKHETTLTTSKSYKLVRKLNEIVNDLAAHYNHTQRLEIEQLNDLFESLISHITLILNSEKGSLMLVDEESGHLYIKAAKGLTEEIISNSKIKVGQGISGQIVNKDIPILVSNIEEDSRFFKPHDQKRYYTKSFLSAPVRLGKVKGVININNKSDKQPYNEKDLTSLGLLMNQIQMVVENNQLSCEVNRIQEETQKLKSDRKIFSQINKLLDKELTEAQISCQINRILSSDLDYSQTIGAIIELIESSLDYHFCGLLILDNLREAELLVSIKYPASEYDLANFKSKVVDDYYKKSDYNIMLENISLNRTNGPAILADTKKKKDVLESFYTVPLNLKNKNLGLLAVSHSRPDAFGSEEKKFISLLAEHSSIAINNATLHKRIKKLSITDGLTGVYCFRYFQEKLEDELKRAQRYQEPLGLIIMDIDGFKQVNDSYGHPAGDSILKNIADMLKNECRDIDIVCRYGGEEFAVILPETDTEGAFYLAERIRKTVKNYEFKSPENDTFNLTVSCGVASYPHSSKEKDGLIKSADDALYKAKNEGKNKTALLDL